VAAEGAVEGAVAAAAAALEAAEADVEEEAEEAGSGCCWCGGSEVDGSASGGGEVGGLV
jgi:hypothetical protein